MSQVGGALQSGDKVLDCEGQQLRGHTSKLDIIIQQLYLGPYTYSRLVNTMHRHQKNACYLYANTTTNNDILEVPRSC